MVKCRPLGKEKYMHIPFIDWDLFWPWCPGMYVCYKPLICLE